MKLKISSFINRIKLYKKLIYNFSYLSVLQIFNLLTPLISYSYLIRVLGKEKYGLIILAQAIISYFFIIVSFGFNISATKEISIHREDKEKVNEIVSSVLIIKSFLFLLSIIFLGILFIFIPRAHGYEILFLLTMSICLNDILVPVWYFQGIEQMKYITYITLISRLTFLSLIFVVIKSPDDYLLVPVFFGVGHLISGIISMLIVFYSRKIQFLFQSVETLTKYFKDSFPIFISNLSVNLYVGTNKVIVATFLGLAEVSYYDLAEKLTSVIKIPQIILNQTLFPKISRDRNIKFVKKIFMISFSFHIILTIVIILFSKQIVSLLGGLEMSPSIWVVNILVLTIPFFVVSSILGGQVLLPFGYNKEYGSVIVISGLVYLCLMTIQYFTIGFSIISISLATLLTEFFVAIYMYYLCKKLNLISEG